MIFGEFKNIFNNAFLEIKIIKNIFVIIKKRGSCGFRVKYFSFLGRYIWIFLLVRLRISRGILVKLFNCFEV